MENVIEATEKKIEKKKFVMPHLFWIMMGLLFIVSVMTYIIPAGKFGTDPITGKIASNEFSYIGTQNPVSIMDTLNLVLQGLMESGLVIWVVLVSAAVTSLVIATGAFDEFLNWTIYKLKDKSDSILICGMFVLMTYLGAFGGTDALIAVVPIGVMFAKKLRLDPICAIGVSTFATLLGFGTGPTKQITTQLLMGVNAYGSFVTMFISMNLFMVIGIIMLLRYIKKIRKDPTQSLMWNEGWRPEEAKVDDSILKNTKLSFRSTAILIVFMAQYAIIVAYPFITGDNAGVFKIMVSVGIITAIICGLLAKFETTNRIGEEFAKGIADLAFVGFVIGLARVMSLVMNEGMILDTIVHTLTTPLMDMPLTFASMAMTGIISVINLLIPSAISKAAILVPILEPVTQTLGMLPELAVQAFQYGDGFTNMFSPFLGWTVGSCVIAGVPFDKWVRWVFPKTVFFMVISCVVMFGLTHFGWQPF